MVISSPAACPEIAQSRLVEPMNVDQHAQKSGAHEIATLRQKRRQRAATVLQRTVSDAGRERHRAGFGAYTQMCKEAGQERVGRLVVDQEAGVDGHRGAIHRDRYGIGMAAQPQFGLEDRDGVAPIQQPGGGEPGDAGADDSDPHVRLLLISPQWAAAGLGEEKPAAPAGRSKPATAAWCYGGCSRLDQWPGPVRLGLAWP